jgi:hypothetical protein
MKMVLFALEEVVMTIRAMPIMKVVVTLALVERLVVVQLFWRQLVQVHLGAAAMFNVLALKN